MRQMKGATLSKTVAVCLSQHATVTELTKGAQLRYPNAAVTQPMLHVAAVLCCIRCARAELRTATAAALVSG
jgi:hypothetical protein